MKKQLVMMNILLIDGQRLFAQGLKSLLGKLPEVQEVYLSDELHFRTEPVLSEVDMVICGMNAPKMTGFNIIDFIRTRLRNQPDIIVLSGINDTQTIRQSLRLGANAFISKEADMDELLEGMAEVKAGKRFISRDLRNSLMKNIFSEEEAGYHLSRREREVLSSICDGQTSKQIGEKLGLSHHTVQYYQRNIMKKLKVTRTIDLVVYAIQNGFYTVPAAGANTGALTT